VSRALAVARAWGVPRTLLLALLLAGSAQLAAASYVGLPAFAADIPALDLVPPAAALVLASPLVDQTPDLTLRAGRPLWQVLTLRYAASHAAGAIVVAGLCLSGWTFHRSLAVVLFLAGSALGTALLGGWFWVPMMGVSYAWLRSQQLTDVGAADVPIVAAAAASVLGGLVYVSVRAWVVRRPLRPGRCPRQPC